MPTHLITALEQGRNWRGGKEKQTDPWLPPTRVSAPPSVVEHRPKSEVRRTKCHLLARPRGTCAQHFPQHQRPYRQGHVRYLFQERSFSDHKPSLSKFPRFQVLQSMFSGPSGIQLEASHRKSSGKPPNNVETK